MRKLGLIWKLLLCLLLSQWSQAQVALKVYKNYESCLYGIVDTLSGDTLFAPQFTSYEARHNYLLVRQNEAVGAVSTSSGKLVLRCRYQKLQSLEPEKGTEAEKRRFFPWFCFKQNDAWGLIHLTKGLVLPPVALHVQAAGGEAKLSGIGRDSTPFMADTTGFIRYFKGCTAIEHRRLKHFIMLRKEGKWSLANAHGDLLFNFEFDWFGSLKGGHVHFKKEETEGFISRNGTLFFETALLEGPLEYGERSYRGTAKVYVPGSGWGYLGMEQEGLNWHLPPRYEYIVQDYGVLYGYKAGYFDVVRPKDGRPVCKGAHQLLKKRVHPDGKPTFCILYTLRHDSLFAIDERSHELQFLSQAEDLKLVWNRKLFVRKQGAWWVLDQGSLRQLDLDFVGIQDLGHNLVRLELQRGYLMADTNGNPWSEQVYERVYPSNQRSHAITYEGEVHLYENNGEMRLCEDQGRFIALKADAVRRDGFLVYDQMQNSFIGTSVYDSVNLLNDTLLVLRQGKLTGVYHALMDSFLARPGQYPLTQVHYPQKQVCFGYDSSSCLYSFSGEALSLWEKVELVAPFKDIGYLVVLDTFSIGIRSRSQPYQWLVPPVYCAIADYDPETGRASVRDCPIERFKPVSYWQQGKVPTAGHWGVVDAEGNWLIEPISEVPIDLYQKTVLLQSDGLWRKYRADGSPLWPDWYAQVAPFDSARQYYWVRGTEGLRGVLGSEGTYKIPATYHYLLREGDGVYAVSFPDSLPNAQVWYYNSHWERSRVTGLRRLETVTRGMAQEQGVEMEAATTLPHREWNTAYKLWYYSTWIKMNSKEEETEAYYEAPYPGPFTNQGFCHPLFKVNHRISRLPMYMGEYAYTRLKDTAHRFGVSVVAEHSGGFSARNASKHYTDYEFINLAWMNGEVRELALWDFLDASCKERLNKELLAKLERAGIDTYCARGLMIDAIAPSFYLEEERLVFYLPPEDDFGQYTLDEGYRQIRFNLEDWPLTPTFEALR